MKTLSIAVLILCAGVFFWNGCDFVIGTGELFASEGEPNDTIIYGDYNSVKLNSSTSTDVLKAIVIPKYEILSQSKSVIASGGVKKRGHKVWFDMVAFEEEGSTAIRKYMVTVDERPKKLFIEPWEGLRFDCESVVDKKVLDEPYATENARRIAILKNVYKMYQDDFSKIEKDNKDTAMRGLMVSQAFGDVILKLDESPAQAAWFDRPEGIKFESRSLSKGRIRMRMMGNIAEVRMILGAYAVSLKEGEDMNDIKM